MITKHIRYQMKWVLLFLSTFNSNNVDIHLMNFRISKCPPFIRTLVLTLAAVFQIRTSTQPLPHPFCSPLVWTFAALAAKRLQGVIDWIPPGKTERDKCLSDSNRTDRAMSERRWGWGWGGIVFHTCTMSLQVSDNQLKLENVYTSHHVVQQGC